ncbi:MAG: TolC family protein, partial [candidate division Zixibacteria bacterium]|nr:TolC family protein [candidate division Zixibacteria bacterium]
LGGRTKSRTASARLELEAAGHHRDEVEESLNEQAKLAYQDLELAHYRFLSSRDETRIASRNYELASAAFAEGALSSNRLVEIEAVLSQAEAALAAAIIDFHVAGSSYLYAMGSAQLSEGL